MSGVIPPPAPTKIQFVELYKKLAQEVAERLSAYGGLSKLASDTFKDSTGINSGLSSGYTYRGTPNFDVIKSTSVNTKMLLHLNDDQGFKDYSSYNRTPTKGSTSKVLGKYKKIGTAAMKGDGTANCVVTYPYSADFDVSGNFTFEFWLYFDASLATWHGIFGYGTAGVQIQLDYRDAVGFTLRFNGNKSFPTTLSVNTWYHIAIVRNSGTITLYQDGVANGTTYSDSTAIAPTGSPAFKIGTQNLGDNLGSTAYLDEIRYSNNARYTANFTPSTTQFSSDANTLLLLHFDANLTDSSPSGQVPAVQNEAIISTTQSKFGGASILLDGTDDYVSVPDSADWDFGTSPLTIDCWIRPATVSLVELGIITQGQDSNNCFTLRFDGGDATKLQFAVYSGGSTLLSMSGTHGMSVNTWYHVAVVRGWGGNANDWALCVNGVAVATATASITMPNLTSPLYIGYDARSTNKYFNGYIDELRMVKGEAKWTASFTPETSEYSTPVAPTQAVIVSERLLNLTTATTLLMMFVDVTLNSGTATYYVSTDDGSTWTTISDLTLIQAVPSGTQIRTKVVLTGDAELEFVGVAVP